MFSRSLTSVLIIILAAAVSVSCELFLGSPSDGMGHPSLRFSPRFQGGSSADIQRGGVENYETEALIFLPQLTSFKENSGISTDTKSIESELLGGTYSGEVSYDPETESTMLTYEVGEGRGLIEIVFKPDDRFDYRQVMLLDALSSDNELPYAIYTIEDAEITPYGDSGEYGEFTGTGDLYFGQLTQVDNGDGTSRVSISAGLMHTGASRVRGTASLLYGVVDPISVNVGDYPTADGRLIGEKSLGEVTIEDLIEKEDLIMDTLSNSDHNTVVSPYDLYYVSDTGRILATLTAETDPTSAFEFGTGTNFDNLGFPSDNLSEFLISSLGLPEPPEK